MEGLIVLVSWFLWPLLGAWIGSKKGEAVTGFIFGLFCGPLGLLPVVMSSGTGVVCPACKGRCPTGATACMHCGRDLPASMRPKRTMAKCPSCNRWQKASLGPKCGHCGADVDFEPTL